MQTKNLSKTDYYKSRNIVIPKPVPKLAPQPPVTQHLLQRIPSLTVQIRKHLEAKKLKENLELGHLGYEPTLHELQLKLQDLTKILAHRQDEITSLKNEKQTDERRINFLDRQVFDLKAQLHKIQYEYKSIIEFIKVESSTQKNEYMERILFLQQQAERAKLDYQNLLKTTKETYDLRIKSFSGSKQALKLTSEQLMVELKRDIETQMAENKRLRNELILSEKSAIQKLRFYEEQNFSLKQKLDQQDLEFSLSVIKANTQLEIRNNKINDLNEQIQEMARTFNSEREKILFEKQNLQKVYCQKENKLRQNFQNLTFQKQKLDKQVTKLVTQVNDLKGLNRDLERKLNEQDNKVVLFQQQKQELSQKYQIKINVLKQSLALEFEEQTQSLKKSHQQQIFQLQKFLEDKNCQIAFLNERTLKLTKQIDEKTILIKSLQEKERSTKLQLQQVRQSNEEIGEQMIKMRKENLNLKLNHQNQRTNLLNAINQQKMMEVERVLAQSSEKLQRKQKQLERVVQQNNVIQQQNSMLTNKIENLSSQYEEAKLQYKNQTTELRKVIERKDLQQRQITQINEHYKEEYEKITVLLAQTQAELQKVTKDLKQSRLDNDQVRLQAIRKCAQYEERMLEQMKKIEDQKHQLIVNLTQAQNQISSLQHKIERAQCCIEILEEEKQMYTNENKRMKESWARKQQTTSNLVNELNLEKEVLAEKISQQYRQKIEKLQQTNKALMKQLGSVRLFEQKMQETVRERTEMVNEMKAKLKQKLAQESKKFQDRFEQYKNQMSKLQAKVIQQQGVINRLQQIQRRIEAESQKLTAKTAEYYNDATDLTSSRFVENDTIGQLKYKHTRLFLFIDETKMDLDYQKEQKKTYQTLYNQLKTELEDKNNLIQNLHEALEKQHQIFEKQFTEVRLNQVKEHYQAQIKQLALQIQQLQKKALDSKLQLIEAEKYIKEKQNAIQALKTRETKYQKNQSVFKQFEIKFHTALQKSKQDLEYKQKMIDALEIELNKVRINKNVCERQAEMRIEEVKQKQKKIDFIVEKCDNLTKKMQQMQKAFSLQTIKMKEYTVSQDQLIESLRKQISEMEYKNEQKLQQKIKQYENFISRLKMEYEQKINEIKSTNVQNQKKLQILANQLKQLQEQKNKYRLEKSEIFALKIKLDAQLAKKDQDILLLQQTIKRITRDNQFLNQYKKRWKKICGDVKVYDNLDPIEAKIVDDSFECSLKSSFIMDQPFITQMERDQLLSQRKIYFEAPEIDMPQQKPSNVASQEQPKIEQNGQENQVMKQKEQLAEDKQKMQGSKEKKNETEKKEKKYRYAQEMLKTKRSQKQEEKKP